MERRWLGSADKTAESGPGWTARIRGDLTAVCKIFRWDVWTCGVARRARLRQRRHGLPFPASQLKRRLFAVEKSLAESPGRIPKTPRCRAESLCIDRRRKRWSVNKSAVEISKPQAKFFSVARQHSACSQTPWNHIPPAAPRLVNGPALLLAHLQFLSLPLLASLEAGKQRRRGGLCVFVLMTNGVGQFKNISHCSNGSW